MQVDQVPWRERERNGFDKTWTFFSIDCTGYYRTCSHSIVCGLAGKCLMRNVSTLFEYFNCLPTVLSKSSHSLGGRQQIDTIFLICVFPWISNLRFHDCLSRRWVCISDQNIPCIQSSRSCHILSSVINHQGHRSVFHKRRKNCNFKSCSTLINEITNKKLGFFARKSIFTCLISESFQL